MRKRIDWQWENLDTNTDRVKVIGGWIVHSGHVTTKSASESLVFVPDSDHEWEIMPPAPPEQPKPTVKAADFEPFDLA